MYPVGLLRSAPAPGSCCSPWYGGVASNEEFCTPALNLPLVSLVTEQVTNSLRLYVLICTWGRASAEGYRGRRWMDPMGLFLGLPLVRDPWRIWSFWKSLPVLIVEGCRTVRLFQLGNQKQCVDCGSDLLRDVLQSGDVACLPSAGE